MSTLLAPARAAKACRRRDPLDARFFCNCGRCRRLAQVQALVAEIAAIGDEGLIDDAAGALLDQIETYRIFAGREARAVRTVRDPVITDDDDELVDAADVAAALICC